MFNVEYKTGQDLDLWIRIALKETIIFNPKVTMIYNKGITNSLSKSEFNDVRYRIFNSFSRLYGGQLCPCKKHFGAARNS